MQYTLERLQEITIYQNRRVIYGFYIYTLYMEKPNPFIFTIITMLNRFIGPAQHKYGFIFFLCHYCVMIEALRWNRLEGEDWGGGGEDCKASLKLILPQQPQASAWGHVALQVDLWDCYLGECPKNDIIWEGTGVCGIYYEDRRFFLCPIKRIWYKAMQTQKPGFS